MKFWDTKQKKYINQQTLPVITQEEFEKQMNGGDKMSETKAVITEKKKEMLAKMPSVETKTFKSKDGKWIINQLIITDIKSVKYVEKVLAGESSKSEEL